MSVLSKSWLQAVLALFDRRSADDRSDLLEMTWTTPVPQHIKAFATTPIAGASRRAPASAPRRKRRTDGGEWSETEPNCHT